MLHEVESSGLTGRGGAGFPAHRKMRMARRSGTRPVLLVNAMEGEPASGKDQCLLTFAPHLVLDGAELVAMAVGASTVVICVPAERRALIAGVQQALGQRLSLPYERPNCQLKTLPGHYISGEESALVSAVSGKASLPQFHPDKSVNLMFGRQPALVHNTETLAHVALIGRHGSDWFRQVGSPEAPGTSLVTISGAVRQPGILEVEIGRSMDDIVAAARPVPDVQAVLVGGYAGTWVSANNLSVPFGPQGLKTVGAAMGAGVLLVLAAGNCGLLETETIARYLAGESAGQCGPCLFGLPAIADELALIVRGHCARGPGAPAGPFWLGRRAGRLPSPRRGCTPGQQRLGRVPNGRQIPLAIRALSRLPVAGHCSHAVALHQEERFGMRLQLDPSACDGFGFCTGLIGEMVDGDEWGFPIVKQASVPAELECYAAKR